MEELTRRPHRGTPRLVGRPNAPHPEQDDPQPIGADVPVSHTGPLGEPLRGDETSALGYAAPDQGVATDYDESPATRRFGDGLVADGINFQSRPSATETPGAGDQSSGGGSGL